MLHQISWQAYVLSIILLLILYYGYVGVVFYRTEILAFYFRISGRQATLEVNDDRLIPVPEYEIMGAAKPDDTRSIREENIEFGPTDNPDDLTTEEQEAIVIPTGTDSRQISQFSEMIAEVKTLIRVINESAETRENFEMLFKLIVQKYHELGGTPYQHQINEFLLEESEGQFPFEITSAELEAYWNNH
ncbi:MAG: hypothetical protein JWR38_2818 [Mucilaginibacter sp.]|nr:hypothetical protein [Mucilaginibacter sp.]